MPISSKHCPSCNGDWLSCLASGSVFLSAFLSFLDVTGLSFFSFVSFLRSSSSSSSFQTHGAHAGQAESGENPCRIALSLLHCLYSYIVRRNCPGNFPVADCRFSPSPYFVFSLFSPARVRNHDRQRWTPVFLGSCSPLFSSTGKVDSSCTPHSFPLLPKPMQLASSLSCS
jgi:hypothetical protein